MYNIAEALRLTPGATSSDNVITDILPTHYISVHQSAVRAITWLRIPPASTTGAFRTDKDPTVIASGGYDGVECLTDIREASGCVMNRTRGKQARCVN